MKTPLFPALAAVSLATVGLAGAQALVPRDTIWQNNFESNSVGASTGASPAVINGFRFGYPGGIVRDSETLAPFGAPNQYLELSPNNNTDPAVGYRAIVTGVLKASYTATPVGISYDFNESTDPGFATIMGFGTGADSGNPDLNNNQGLIALQFRNGAITLGARTSLVAVGDPDVDPQVLPAFTEGVAYRATWIVNFTNLNHEVLGPDGAAFNLDPMQGAFWFYNPATETFAPRVVLENNNARELDNHVSFLFRHFSNTAETQRQTIYVDNMLATTFGKAPALWTGGGSDALWSNPVNWLGGFVPEPDDIVIFSGDTNIDPENNLPADTQFPKILFQDTASSFSLGGNRVTLTERITNDSPLTQIVRMPLWTDATPLLAENLTAGTTLALEGNISGFGDLLKKGAGALELSGTNDFSGNKTVDQGAVVVLNNQSAATGSWHLRGYGATGTTFGSAATTTTFASAATVVVGAAGFVQAGHTSASGGTQAQSLISSANVTNHGTLFLGRSGTLSVNGGTWTQNGTATVATQGGGLATLNINSGSFSYNNAADFVLSIMLSNNTRTRLNINSGTFITGSRIHNPQAGLSPENTAYSDIILANGGILRLSADIADLFTTAGANNRFLVQNGGGTIDTNGFSTTLNIPITGDGGLTKAGGGTLTTTGTNDYSGDTTVNAGTLSVAGPDFDDASTVTVAADALLDLNFAGTDTIGALVLGGTTYTTGTFNSVSAPGSSFLMGSGQLTVSPPPGDTFASWAAGLGLSGNPDADFDNDGTPDALEYVLGTDPKAADAAGLVTTSQTATDLILSFTRDDRSKSADITLSVEAGTDLATWPQSFAIGETTATSTPGVTVTPNGNGSDTVTTTIPKLGAPKLFARIKVAVAND